MNLIFEAVRSWPGTLGLMVLDHAAEPIVAWNADVLLPSASVIKAPLAWQWLETGQTSATHTIQPGDIIDPDGVLAASVGQTIQRTDIAREMIVTSDNNATNLVLDWVGGFDAANRWLRDHHLHHTRWQRRMCDWEARAAGAENQTCARDMAVFFHSLHQSKHTHTAARIAYTWLEQCLSEGKLDRGLPVEAQVAHKTGSLPDGIEHDVGIVAFPDLWYAVAILSHIPEPEIVHRARIAQLSRLLFEALR